jgi:hypothetical protein
MLGSDIRQKANFHAAESGVNNSFRRGFDLGSPGGCEREATAHGKTTQKGQLRHSSEPYHDSLSSSVKTLLG